MLFECSKSWRQIFIIKTEKYGERHAKIERGNELVPQFIFKESLSTA